MTEHGPAREVLRYIDFVEGVVPAFGRDLVTRPTAELDVVRRASARRALQSPQMQAALMGITDFVRGMSQGT